MKTKLIYLMLLILASAYVTSCSKDDDGDKEEIINATLNKTSVTLYVDETSVLTYSGGKCTWSTDNYLVAEVDNGVVKAKHVGETTIHANDLTCKVTVKPKYNTYKEPFMGWGSSKSTVKNNMAGYTLKGEDDTNLVYLGKGNITAYAYLFENGLLHSSAFYASLINSLDLSDFLLERYWVVDIEEKGSYDYEILLGSVDLNMGILFSVTSSGCLVAYYEVDTKSSSREQFKEKIKKMHNKQEI